MFRLMQGDCLNLLEQIPEKSIDMILIDPPYGTTACAWDSVIDLQQMWAHIKRVIKPARATAIFATQPFTSKLISSNPDQLKYCWYWNKNNPSGFAQAKNMPLKCIEEICIFSDGVTLHASQAKDRRLVYYPQGLIHKPRVQRNANRDPASKSAFGSRPSHNKSYVQEFTNYPRQMLNFQVERGLHPTQKPVPLLEYLIRTYTKPGETVLDFTMGSGSTGIACLNSGRDFIGMEMDEQCFELAKNRISLHKSIDGNVIVS